jgi:hypothetical protein
VVRVDRSGDGEPSYTEVARSEGRRAFLQHSFAQPGEHEIRCSVQLSYEDASPALVLDHVIDRVQSLEARMALDLATLEQLSHQGTAVWSTSSIALLAAAHDRLRAAEQATPRNDALVDSLRSAVERLERQLSARTAAGPFGIQAIFADRRTGISRPISLFVGPAPPGEQNPGTQTWLLIDLTFPTFYRTYTGEGQSVGEAVRAAFESARTSFRGKYPPGRILARIEWAGMSDYALAPFDFGTDTESWERSAYDWLSLGASALGAIGLAAALVFPPTTAVVAAIVVTGAVAGAAVATINIAERVTNNAFEWDRELAVDLLSIATAFAALSGVALRGATAGVSRAIAAGEPVTFTMVNRLRQVVGLQRAVLYLDLGNAIGGGFLLVQEAYLELREVDASLGPEALPEFRRLYGADEGQRRWEAERLTRILGILARAAVNGGITVVSIRSGRAALADAGRRYADWHIPGAERPPSTRITVPTGPPLPAFPAVAGTEMRAFRQAQVDGVIARLGLAGDPAALAITDRLSPQVAWSINTAFDALSESQRLLVTNVMRPGGADLQALRRRKPHRTRGVPGDSTAAGAQRDRQFRHRREPGRRVPHAGLGAGTDHLPLGAGQPRRALHPARARRRPVPGGVVEMGPAPRDRRRIRFRPHPLPRPAGVVHPGRHRPARGTAQPVRRSLRRVRADRDGPQQRVRPLRARRRPDRFGRRTALGRPDRRHHLQRLLRRQPDHQHRDVRPGRTGTQPGGTAEQAAARPARRAVRHPALPPMTAPPERRACSTAESRSPQSSFL